MSVEKVSSGKFGSMDFHIYRIRSGKLEVMNNIERGFIYYRNGDEFGFATSSELSVPINELLKSLEKGNIPKKIEDFIREAKQIRSYC